MQKPAPALFTLIVLLGFLTGLPCPSAGQTGTFTEVYSLACGDTIVIGGLGYPTWSIPHILKRPGNGHAILIGDFIEANILQYQSPPCFSGRDTVIIECAHATQITCDTGIYIFEMTCPEVLEPVYPVEVACNDSVYVGNLSGWAFPEILQGPANGIAEIILEPTDGAGVFYRPNPGFEGLDAVKVRLVNFQDTLLYLFQVYCDQFVSATSQDPRQASGIRLFPNPAGDFVFFHSLEPVGRIKLLDITGKSVPARFSQENELVSIQIHHLAKGLYIVVVDGDKNRGAARIYKR